MVGLRHVEPGAETKWTSTRSSPGRRDAQGRWELRDGQPVMMAPERALHALTKYAAQKRLKEAIQRAGLPCRVFPDGMTVRIAARTAFEPDALVVCPPPTDLNTMEIPNPVIVVEVLSPSTAADDHGVKLDGYFSLASVAHYLILDPDRRVMIHHRRGPRGSDRNSRPARRRGGSRPARIRGSGGGVFRGGLSAGLAAIRARA